MKRVEKYEYMFMLTQVLFPLLRAFDTGLIRKTEDFGNGMCQPSFSLTLPKERLL
jgi:hypothetical protein